MAAISDTLRQARIRSGIDLASLADKTKINPRYLHAIEAGDFGQLPSGIFARMFVKQYAEAVGLDGASFAEEFQRITSFGDDSGPDIRTLAETQANYRPNVPGISSVGDRVRSDRLASMLSSFIWAVTAVLVCAGAYYGLAHLPSRSTAAEAVPQKAASQVQPVEAGKPAVAPAAASPTTSAPAATPQSDHPVPVVEGSPASSAAIQLGIFVTEPVWVTASADGKTVFSQLLNPGTSKIVDATASARLTLGNAGGAEITFNGKKLEPLGPKGQVRTVEFTPQDFQVISRTSPKVEPSANPDPLR